MYEPTVPRRAELDSAIDAGFAESSSGIRVLGVEDASFGEHQLSAGISERSATARRSESGPARRLRGPHCRPSG